MKLRMHLPLLVLLSTWVTAGSAAPIEVATYEELAVHSPAEYTWVPDVSALTGGSGLGAAAVPGEVASVLAPRRTVFGSFDINVVFTGSPTSSQIAAFNRAELFWESRILGYESQALGDFMTANFPTVDITANFSAIDGPGNILASAGPTGVVATGGSLATPPNVNNVIVTTTGSMSFDTADVATLEAGGSFDIVILHEMAHVIGFSDFFWDFVLATDGSGTDTSYTGAFGLAAYQEIDPLATFVPVENNGGPGTAFSHWDEDLFASHLANFGNSNNPELMTGFLDVPATLSNATLGAFEDIGYVVAYDANNAVSAISIPVPMPGLLLLSGIAMLRLQRRQA